MELPEIYLLSHDMSKELIDKEINELEVKNVKCLNLPLNTFKKEVIGRKILDVKPRGKWVFIQLDNNSYILYNTGMGANTLYYPIDTSPQEPWHIKLGLDDGSGFTSRVWWFCYLHFVKTENLLEHKMTKELGPTPLDSQFTPAYLRKLFKSKGRVKNILMNQKKLAGIGNVYIHDPLFLASIHPLKAANTLKDEDVNKLHSSILDVINESIRRGGLAYEYNFYGAKGNYGKPQYRVAYKEGEPCPVCSETIQKIKTGSTSSYICPKCQPL